MVLSNKLLIIFVIYLISNAQSGKVCDFTNNECATQAAKKNFELIKSGVPGVMEPLDQIREDRIEGETPTLKYVLNNPTLEGFNNCEVILLSFDTKEEMYEYKFQCPHLIFNFEYTAKGSIGDVNIEQEGSFVITADDYIITFKGKYQKMTDKDDKLHIFIETHKIETEPKGKITFHSKFLRKGDKAKADAVVAYLNNNYQSMEKVLRNPTLDILMSNYIESLNKFLKYFPVDNALAD